MAYDIDEQRIIDRWFALVQKPELTDRERAEFRRLKDQLHDIDRRHAPIPDSSWCSQ